MTEEEWLKATDPRPMLEFVEGRVSERKLRLFACACARVIWSQLTSKRSRGAVEAAELFADGLIPKKELRKAGAAASAAMSSGGWADHLIVARGTADAYAPGTAGTAIEFGYKVGIGRRLQCDYFRDLFGPLPIRTVTISPSWFSWSDATIPKIARSWTSPGLVESGLRV